MTILGKTILFLGSEYNQNHSINGNHISMQVQVEQWLKTKKNPNPKFFTILEAQLRSLGLIDRNNKMLAKIIFDDVSKVLAGGKQSPNHIYRKNVEKSVDFHRKLLEKEKPDVVVIGGVSAFNEYTKQIVNKNTIGFKPKVILRVRNQSSEAHRATSTWVKYYNSESLANLVVNYCINQKNIEKLMRPVLLRTVASCTKNKQKPWQIKKA